MPLDERQRKLVALLLAGHTDASAAGRLGISPRTVTNILRALMDRLGVDNRFQLGVARGSRMRAPDRPIHPPRRGPGPGEPMPEFGVPMPSARRGAST
jgi:DNA-binding CsgD family transcriptional regulator